jgi:hypothetical protein
MVRRYLIAGALAALTVLAVRPATASGIPSPATLTGNVAQDMPAGPGVLIIPNNTLGDPNNPFHVAQPAWMTAMGRISGWDFKDVRLEYNPTTDTMLVGMKFFSIAGDADGNGTQGSADAQFISQGGSELPHLGGAESIAVRLDYIGTDGQHHAIIAGVPADKTVQGHAGHGGPGTDQFNVTQALTVASPDIAFNFGNALPNHTGNLLFDPSAAHPDIEFTITNFKSLPFFDMKKGFSVSAFAGNPDAILVGKDSLVPTQVSAEQIGPSVPEPSTLLGWSLVVGAAAWRLRRRRPAA